MPIELSGFIDLHIHSAPDVQARKLDDFEVARQAAAVGMAGVMLKSHVSETATRAAITRKYAGVDIQVWGGLALNSAVGGFNPAAVEAALKLGARQVWMPTVDAANEKSFQNAAGGLSIFDSNRKIREEVYAVLSLIAQYDAILGTGHLGVEEIVALVADAKAEAVKRILVTHPDSLSVDIPVGIQHTLARQGCYFERCWLPTTMPGRRKYLSPTTLINRIAEVGIETTILSTDFGQPNNPTPVEGLQAFVEACLENDFTEDQVRQMGAKNPAALVAL